MTITKHAAALLICMTLAAVGAHELKPTVLLADVLPRLDLENSVPVSFGSWRVDSDRHTGVVNPQAEEELGQLYSQTLARTYTDSVTGDRIMLSIAYGIDQTDSLRLHTPESCYPAQGFNIDASRAEKIDLAGFELPVRRLLTRRGDRIEPLTYWTTIGERVELRGPARRFIQFDYGRRGLVPDGLIFRVSTIESNAGAAWDVQQRFIREILAAVPSTLRSRLAGGLKAAIAGAGSDSSVVSQALGRPIA